MWPKSLSILLNEHVQLLVSMRLHVVHVVKALATVPCYLHVEVKFICMYLAAHERQLHRLSQCVPGVQTHCLICMSFYAHEVIYGRIVCMYQSTRALSLTYVEAMYMMHHTV